MKQLTTTVQMDINEMFRQDIKNRLSGSLGSFIAHIGKTELATWTPEEWDTLLDIGVDVCVAAAFMQRVRVMPPYDVEYPPPY